jgi:hypothetical protein
MLCKAGADPGFQVRGAHLKKLCQAFLGVFRVKNHDFTPKNHTLFTRFSVYLHRCSCDVINSNSNSNSSSLLILNPTKDCHQQKYNQQTYTKHETIKNEK